MPGLLPLNFPPCAPVLCAVADCKLGTTRPPAVPLNVLQFTQAKPNPVETRHAFLCYRNEHPLVRY